MRRSKPHRLVQRLSQGMTVRWNEATLTRAEEDERYWKEDGGVEEEGGKKDCLRTRAPPLYSSSWGVGRFGRGAGKL